MALGDTVLNTPRLSVLHSPRRTDGRDATLDVANEKRGSDNANSFVLQIDLGGLCSGYSVTDAVTILNDSAWIRSLTSQVECCLKLFIKTETDTWLLMRHGATFVD